MLNYIHQITIIGQQLGKVKKQRLKEYSEEFGSINIKTYEYMLEKSR